jgi:hypothetical protein
MKMVDYESGRVLRDISIELSRVEAEELSACLARMLTRTDLHQVFLTDVAGGLLDKELTLSIWDPSLAP